MKKFSTASALIIAAAASASAGSLEPVGDRIGIHRSNGCEIVIYAEPRTALLGLLTTKWKYTAEGRACINKAHEVSRDDGDRRDPPTERVDDNPSDDNPPDDNPSDGNPNPGGSPPNRCE